MGVADAATQAEISAEFAQEIIRIVARYFGAAATLWPVWCEACYERESARFEGAVQCSAIGCAVFRLDEKVKSGTVVPQIEMRGRRFPAQDVCGNPIYLWGRFAQPSPRRVERLIGQINHRYIAKIPCQQPVYQP